MRSYELTLIIDAKLDEKNRKQVLDKVRKIISGVKAKIVKETDWGVKLLSYPINKHDEGWYVYLEIEAMPAEIIEAEKKIKLEEQILRYLLISKE